MKNKKIMIGIIVLSFLIISMSIISAGCCEKTKSGAWGQGVDESECAEGYKFTDTACSSTTYGQKGTCVNADSGVCKINVAKAKCEHDGGVWKDQDPREIPACQPGCCLYGNQATLVNKVECKQIASDYGVDIDFQEQINTQGECIALASTQQEGACVIENEYETNCLRTTKKQCLDKKDNKGSSDVLGLFDFSSDRSKVKVDFYGGYLCTAEELNTDCAATDNTRCEGDRVHFVDTCGNLANIYDERMYPMEKNGDSRDYWTEIQGPKCNITGTTSNSCGDCNYRTGTMCATYEKNDGAMPNDPPKYGNKVCRDLACYHEGERYEHGESWCAETKGTYPHLPKNIEKDSEIWNELTSLRGVTEEYNVPGSRYVKLECRNGQVLEQPCKDYRNAVCMEEVQGETEHPDGDDKYTQASCTVNPWMGCLNITNRNDCESNGSMCKWVEGYRFDFENTLKNSGNEDTILLKNSDKQGSCLPLISPGYDFWNSSELAHQGIIRENIKYEVGVWESEDRGDLKSDASYAAERCYSQNCYAIPNYGAGVSEEDWREIWDGDKGQIKIRDNNYISYRKGAYCPGKTGNFIGKQPDCTKSSGGNDKIAQPPIFRNHTQWINSIIYRARSLGDVGYKKSVGDYWSQKSAERIVSQLQKLDQDMDVKENMTDEIVMYQAGEYTDENQRMESWIGKMFNELTSRNKRKDIGF